MTFSLVKTLSAGAMLRGDVGVLAKQLLVEVEELSSGLRGKKVGQAEWQTKAASRFFASLLCRGLEGAGLK